MNKTNRGIVSAYFPGIYLIHISVDCEWDDWQIGECDEPCGGGFRTKTRVPKVDEKHGGNVCIGHSKINESCNIQECPGTYNMSFEKVQRKAITIFMCC